MTKIKQKKKKNTGKGTIWIQRPISLYVEEFHKNTKLEKLRVIYKEKKDSDNIFLLKKWKANGKNWKTSPHTWKDKHNIIHK